MPDRNEAWELLCEYTKGESLRKHALAVEAAMRASVKRYGSADDDEDEWGLVGLLHDFDYEMFPTAEQHPFTGANILCGRGYSERFIRAIMGHATYTGVPRDTAMARALFATLASAYRSNGESDDQSGAGSGRSAPGSLPMLAGEMSIITPSLGSSSPDHFATSAKFHQNSSAVALRWLGGGPGS